jgi:acyl-coenzyme A synthetase/AMP-(fatty) acid ligase
MTSALEQAWEKTLRRRAHDRAIVEAASGATCTFRELDERAAAWLNSLPAEIRATLARRAVVFAIPNGIRWLEIFIGLIRAGAVAVPLDSAEPLVTQRAIAEALRAGFWWEGGRFVAVPRPRRFRDPSIAVIKLTSGSTGAPKPLPATAAQLLADSRQVTGTMGITARDLNYGLIPFGHAYGLGSIIVPLLAQGVPAVCGALPLPHAIAEDFARWRPTVFPTVPAVFRALANSEITTTALASLRLAVSAGAPLPPDVAQEFLHRFGKRIHAFYGSSETGGIAYDRTGAETLRGGIGRALAGVRITRVRGERIRISSAAVFTIGNARRVGAHGAWIPPDRVQIDARGNLTLLGRRGAVVKIAGRRVNLAEVAARLRRVPGVRDAWVGINGSAEPILGAALATSRAASEIRAELIGDTAPWKIPKRWTVLSEFPLTVRGKTDTRALQEMVFR